MLEKREKKKSPKNQGLVSINLDTLVMSVSKDYGGKVVVCLGCLILWEKETTFDITKYWGLYEIGSKHVKVKLESSLEHVPVPWTGFRHDPTRSGALKALFPHPLFSPTWSCLPVNPSALTGTCRHSRHSELDKHLTPRTSDHGRSSPGHGSSCTNV